MEKSREELERELAEVTVKLGQYQLKGQRLENRLRDYTCLFLFRQEGKLIGWVKGDLLLVHHIQQGRDQFS